MTNTVKILGHGKYWVCANMDLLADIIEEGTEFLLSDGRRIFLPFDCGETEDFKYLKTLEFASDDEVKQYCREKYGYIFDGDEIEIYKGRKMVGEHKIVKKGYRYEVAGTYGKVYTDYLVFTDGTKCNINNCKVVNTETQFEFKTLVSSSQARRLLNVGGRV